MASGQYIGQRASETSLAINNISTGVAAYA